MKKLVYIDPQSYRNLAMYDYSLLRGIKNYKVIYCCNKQYDASELDNVEFQPVFTYRKEMNSMLKTLSYLHSLIKLVLILKREKPDVLHIQWWKQWNIDYYFLSVYKKYVKQIVFTAHNLVPHNTGQSMVNKCIKYYKRVDKIIVHDENSKKELVKTFGIEKNKIGVIAHGVLDFKVDEKEVESIMNNLCDKYQLKNKLVFATMGGQSIYKGTDLISDAFQSSNYLKNNNDVFLIFAGKGNIVKQDLANDCNNVLIANYELSDSEFQAIMRLTDVLLLPYRKISQSGVLLTAIQNQIPFAVTQVGGLTDPLDIAPIGWIIPNQTIESVRDCMEQLTKDKISTKAIKLNTSKWHLVKEKYDWTNISIQTVKLYEM